VQQAKLSAILVAPYGFREIQTTISHLLAQSLAKNIELVIVVKSGAQEPQPSAWNGFHSVQVRELLSLDRCGQGYAAGVHIASSPLVALCEDHSYPQPGWAEYLIASYLGGHSIVCPRIENANPDNWVSWASYILNFSYVGGDAPSGPMDAVPNHHCCYDRNLLLTLGDSLADLLGMEAVLHRQLRQQGLQLYLESRAVNRHINVKQWRSLVLQQKCGAQIFASLRAREWPMGRKILYVVAAPLTFVLRFTRLAKEPGRFPIASSKATIRLGLLVGLAAGVWGECCGLLFGVGSSSNKLFLQEHRKTRELQP
jgi:hypothetical protein